MRVSTCSLIAVVVLSGSVGGIVFAGQDSPVVDRDAELPIRIVLTDDGARVLAGEDLFTRFVVGDVQKPFFYPVHGPHGERVTRGYPIVEPSPGETSDHAHHTSLWFAHGDVDGHDFWHGGRGERVVHLESRVIDEETTRPGLESTLEWRDKDGVVVCHEQRVVRFEADEGIRSLDFDITLTPASGPVTFGDTKEGTFALRLAAPLRLTGPVARGSARNSDGVVGREIWGKRARWVEYAGSLDGEHELGVVIFDHPENPRYPTWWHARDYGLVAANPFGAHDFEKQPRGAGDLTLEPGQSLRLRYRILIHAASWDGARIDQAFEDWARPDPAP